MASSSKFPTLETVEDIFKNYSARRAAIIRALTDDFDRFYSFCDPVKEEAFCLFGHPNGLWEVAEPSKHVPLVLPEPVLGINYFRDELEDADWFSMIAIHSDCWLLSLAFFTSAKLLNRKERKRLLNMINDLPTIYEVVTGSKQDNPTIDSRSKRRSSSKRSNDALTRSNSKLLEERNKEECSSCGYCGKIYILDEFWIYCDMCQRWFHGGCVKITPAGAESTDLYECPYWARLFLLLQGQKCFCISKKWLLLEAETEWLLEKAENGFFSKQKQNNF